MDRSSLSLAADRSIDEERKYNLNFLKQLYTFFFFELLVAFTWCSFCVAYPDTFKWVGDWWVLGLILLIISGLLIVFCMYNTRAREPPINLLTYILFTIFFAYGLSWLCLADKSLLAYFCVTCMTLIALGFMLYAM